MVAGKVKTLAAQTAKATEEIGAPIGQTQAATDDAVTAIRGISSTVTSLSGITDARATQPVSGDVQGVAASTDGVTGLAEETGCAAFGGLDASSRIARHADAIRGAVRSFLRDVKAAQGAGPPVPPPAQG